MSIQLYKLSFPSGMHLDAGSYGYETSEVMIHSDTLFSALCCCANLLGGDAWVNKLLSDLVISSAFPYAGERLFFPKPLHLAQPAFSAGKYSEQKAYRKVRFFEKSLLEAALQEKLDIASSFDGDHVKNGCWFSQDAEEIYKTIEHPRVVIDRITNQTTIFHFQEVHFASGCGLFFIADCGADTQLETILNASLGLLGDEGIGSDGTVGKGLFDFTIDKSFKGFPAFSGNRYYLLSLYHPTADEVALILPANSNYDIITRRGWSSAWGGMDLRRQSLRMFVEGSVVEYSALTSPTGDNIAIMPDLPHVMRYGKALTLKINPS
ncbi:MAG: type III-A CRISPR-associated RAMP protein Csm4 [Saprospiraceae bacterium]|nr:type III-A CRISPR-associated RAMP protein Csm4 [Saprospiraceae bacterium]